MSAPPALDVRDAEGGATLLVRVRPRSAREGIVGVREGALLVGVAAPPVDGEANAAVARLLARALGVPPSGVQVLRGAASRGKRLRIAGLGAAEVLSRLRAFASEG